MKTEIININDKGQFNGYQEWYWKNKIRLRGNFKNGNKIGYQEFHMVERIHYFIK